ncbi:RICIN domain-containing protein [Actinomadura sp. 9N215]|uniref:RICIN domain-containing protein n=1 Tax=Actinomadura sp. 9N215 TaxID=3375150 RepID=UPI0037A93655
MEGGRADGVVVADDDTPGGSAATAGVSGPAATYPRSAASSTGVNLPTRRCLDVRWGNGGDGAAIGMFDCWGGTPQQWSPAGNRLVSGVATNKCLSVLNNNFGYGGAVVNWNCNGGDGQAWRT